LRVQSSKDLAEDVLFGKIRANMIIVKEEFTKHICHGIELTSYPDVLNGTTTSFC
jgi:hypothetical protein